MKPKGERTFTKLRDLLDEQKWDEFITNVEERLKEMLGSDVKVDLTGLKVEYKRDKQDAVNTAITAGIEEKAKEFICPRIPEWMQPDHLTIIGIIGVLMTSVGFVLGFINRNWLLLVPTGLIVNWFGDSFDGSIARYRKRTRPNYGYYIDKIVDAVVVIIFALGIGLSGFVKIEIALLLSSVYLAMMLHVDLVVHVENKSQNSFGLFGPTEIRIIGIIFVAIMYFIPVNYYDIYGHFLTQYDFAVFGLSVIMFIILLVSILREGLKLHKEDIKKWNK
ncbi:MAG: CDP-alcohol phosphatidyltransferase family protein [Candidatus Dojkabacteria bacterium]|jgi:phosphatidylglycerophosphate synthase|nr:CDP-alcohol phosphatidyltransferase family protein [Candidatus Dojkabacteria bacterium]